MKLHMNLLHGSPRLARLAGTAALTAGLAGTMASGAPAASAGVNFPVINQKAVIGWGANTGGQLGNGTRNDSTLPGSASGLVSGIVQVAAGFSHGLALRTDGTVWAWGNNRNGQLGNGVISEAQLTPVQVTGLSGVTKIAAGGTFSLALRKDRTVWAWGNNTYGELGNGTTADSSVPVQVTGLSQVTSIAAGGDPGSSFAIRISSTGVTSLWAWGDNSRGELGDGTLNAHSTPEQVTGFSVPGIAGISAGDAFAFLLGTDGSVWAWGLDDAGQLGNAPSPQGSNRPIRTIAPGSGITQLAAGVTHALAVRSNGTVLAWGDNTRGELGDGSRAAASGPVQVTGLTSASQVSAGSRFSLAVGELPAVGSP